MFDSAGKCLEQPYEQTEDPDSSFKDRVTIKAYPAQCLVGAVALGYVVGRIARAGGSRHAGK